MSNLVDSVEFIEHTFASSDTTSSVILSKDQDITKCVPFISHYGSTDYPDGQFYDVWFDYSGGSPYIYFQRHATRSSTLYLKINVVEFNSTKVKVYQGELPSPISTTETGTTVSGGPYVSTHAALKFYCMTESTNSNFVYHLVRGQLTTYSGTYGDEPTFSRRYNTGSITQGHYYVFESIADDFTVSHMTGSLTAGIVQYPKVYDWHNSFLLTSYSSNDAGLGDLYQSTIRSYLWANSGVAINAHSTAATVHYNTQLIEFDNDATISGVRYCPKITSSHSMGVGVTERNFTFEIPVSQSTTMITAQNPTRCVATELTQHSDSWHAAWLTNSGTGFSIKRSTSLTAAYPTYYLVDWEGSMYPQYPDLGTSVPLNNPSTPVKSVENISTTIPEHVNKVILSKGQDVSNCIVFKSGWADQTGSTNQTYKHQFTTYFRGNELYLERGNEGYTHYSELSVVEFYPEQVKVQQGTFVIGISNESVSVTIDTVDTSKTFLVFGSFYGDSTIYWNYHMVRGRITDSTTLTFSRGDATSYPVMGTWYLAEDLGDNWFVRHWNSSKATTTTYGLEFDQAYSDYSTVDLISTEVEGTTDDGDECTWRVYYNNSLQPARADKDSPSFNNTVSIQVINFLPPFNIKVYYTHRTFSGTDTSITYSLPDDMATSSGISTVWSSLNGVMKTRSADGLANVQAWARSQYLPESNEVNLTRRVHLSDYSEGTTFVVDWAGTETGSGNENYSSLGALVKSIERFSYVGSSGRKTWYPSKSQDMEYCLPIGTWSIGENTGTDPERFLYSFWTHKDIARVVLEAFWGANNPGIDVEVSLIEFDPAQVRIQKGSGFIANGTHTDLVTIDAVDTSKAFIMCYSLPSDGVLVAMGGASVAARFNSSTELDFRKGISTGNVAISWYVVECLQDQWIVDHSEITNYNSTTYNLDFGAGSSSDKTISVGSIASDQINTDPSYAYYRLYPNFAGSGLRRTTVNRQLTSYQNERVNSSRIVFNDNSGVTVTPTHFSLAGTTNSTTVAIGRSVDPEKTVFLNGLQSNTSRGNSTDQTNGPERCFTKVTLQDDSTVLVERVNAGLSCDIWGHVYMIEFDMRTHSTTGIVSEKGAFVERNLNLHSTATGELLSSTTSSGLDGTYELGTSYSGSTYVVCFDDEAGVDYNGLIETDIYPVESPKSPLNGGGS